jgi:hypothetical protein
MASTENRLSQKVSEDSKGQVIVKLTISRNKRPCFKSGVYVNPKYFKSVKETAKGNVKGIVPPKKNKLNFIEAKETTDAKNKLDSFVNRLLKICQVTEEKNKESLTKEWIEKALFITANTAPDDITYNLIVELSQAEEKVEQAANKRSFFDLMELYLEKRNLSEVRIKNYRVIIRALKRYETFVQLSDKKRKDFV